jgi:hypothetical protein
VFTDEGQQAVFETVEYPLGHALRTPPTLILKGQQDGLFGAQPISGKDVVVAEVITEVNVGDPQSAVRTPADRAEEEPAV